VGGWHFITFRGGPSWSYCSWI